MGEGKRRVLLVDDDPDILQIVSKRLQVEGFEVLLAHDGEEAITKAREELPDIIIMDLMMPKCDGFQACKLLRQDERFKQTPIIFFTGRYSQMDDTIVHGWGADAFLRKQEGGKALIDQMNVLLERIKP